VLHGHGAGDANPLTVVEHQLIDRSSNGFHGASSRLQPREILHGLQQHIASRHGAGIALEQLLPGNRVRLPLGGCVQSRGQSLVDRL